MVRINLDRLLAERHMTQSELAALTGIRPSTICDMFNNNAAFIKLDNMDKICAALQCDAAELVSFISSEQ
ncbi:MAG: helix-turn-helix transcriptional regulator [Oscillospiraceae bacterium]|nr:helix-turn-helix transcriptional regulator [Oscillospiraceae bacterium]